MVSGFELLTCRRFALVFASKMLLLLDELGIIDA